MLNAKKRVRRRESGQALIEFLMLMPVLMTFIWYMIHVNLAINKSIVGQVSARSQLFLKLFNHHGGPMENEFNLLHRAVYYLGVAGDVVQGEASSYAAPTEMLGMGAIPQKMSIANDEPGEAQAQTLRQNIRIRTVVGICTERKLPVAGGALTTYCGSVP